jgi:hypothetical protein
MESNCIFSTSFVNQCVDYVQQLKSIRPQVTIQSLQTSQLNPHSDVTSPLGLLQSIFSQPDHYAKHIERYLTPQQSQILIDAVAQPNLFRSDFDWDYLLGHLPFYKSVLALIGELDPSGNQNMFIFPMIQEWINYHCCHVVDSNFLVIFDHLQLQVNLRLQSQTVLKTGDISDLIDGIGLIAISLLSLYDVTNPEPLNLTYTLTQFGKKLDYFDRNPLIEKFLIERLKPMSDLKYNYPEFTNPISSLSVNSGVTLSLPTHKQIKIWRQEEFKKVFVHELIHYYELEKGEVFTEVFNVNISNNYPPYPKELFTELQTWLFNLLWVLSQKNQLVTTQVVMETLNRERLYAMAQFCHLLKHYHINVITQFIGTNLADQYCVNANSSVLYYYIYKAVILFRPTQAVENLLLPQKGKDTTDQIVSQLRITLGSKSFQKSMNEWLQTLDFPTDSLRMMSQ